MAEERKKSTVTLAAYTNRSWIKPNDPKAKMIYYHSITFANGDSGEYGSFDVNQQKFVIGSEVEYTIEQVERGGHIKNIIKPIRQNTGGYGGGGGNYQRKDDPKTQLRIAKMVAYECALDFMNNSDHAQIKQGHDYAYAKQFLDWIKEKGLEHEKSMTAANALRRAIQGMTIKAIRIPDEKQYLSVMKKADEIFNYYMSE